VGFAEFAQFIVAGLKNGAIYALVALGFTMVYSATGAINFAQGEFFMLGGMLTWFFSSLGVPLAAAVPLAVVATSLVAVVFELVAVRPVATGDPLKIIMVTIGGSVLLRQLAFRVFGPDERPVSTFSAGASVHLLGAAIDRQTLWVWGVTLAVVLALALLYGRTGLGRGMRATAIDRTAARLVGIDTRRMVTISFALAAALGALGGAVVAPLTQASFDAGVGIGVKGFAAAVLGGLGNPAAAVGGGLVLGLLESLTAGYINPTYKDAVAILVLLGVLFIRPQGLFGGRKRDKV